MASSISLNASRISDGRRRRQIWYPDIGQYRVKPTISRPENPRKGSEENATEDDRNNESGRHGACRRTSAGRQRIRCYHVPGGPERAYPQSRQAGQLPGRFQHGGAGLSGRSGHVHTGAVTGGAGRAQGRGGLEIHRPRHLLRRLQRDLAADLPAVGRHHQRRGRALHRWWDHRRSPR